MELVKTVENKLLKRKEIKGTATTHGATPTRVSLRKELAKQLKVEENLIIIKGINSSYGSNQVDVEANVYEDRETLEKLTLDHIKKRNAIEEVVEEVKEEPAPAKEEVAEEPATQESSEEEPKKEE